MMSLRKSVAGAAVCLLVCLCPCAAETDATVSEGLPDAEGAIGLLELQKAWIKLAEARERLETTELLSREGLAPTVDLLSARGAVKKAEIEFEQKFISVGSISPRLTIVSAVKTQKDGKGKKVRLTLQNPRPSSIPLDSLGIPAEAVPLPDEVFRLGDARDVTVSLEEDGTIISQPYEIHLPRLEVGREVTLEFDLLRDVETVGVSLAHDGMRDLRTIYLQKDPSVNQVAIQTLEFSQEAEMGTEAVFRLDLEHFGGGAGVFRLRAMGLPEPIHHEFQDPESGARLTQIKFTESGASQRLVLQLHLPDVAGRGVEIDKPIEFRAAVIPSSSDEEEAPIAGEVELGIIPRGVGRIEVITANLFQEIRLDESASVEVRVRNGGTRELDNVVVTGALPVHWKGIIEPKLVPSLLPGAEEVIRLEFLPPDDVVMGEYVARIHVEATSAGRLIEHPDVEDRVRVSAPPRYLATAGLFGGAIVLLVGTIVLGARLTRR